MNIFSNIGLTELIIILLLALLVVGPERLPEVGRKIGQGLRDLRKAYENLTRDLGPELQSIQRSTQELRESVNSVRSIPQDVVKKVVQAADLDDTIADLKSVADGADQMRKTLSSTAKAVQSPVSTAVSAAKGTFLGYPDVKTGASPIKTEQHPSGGGKAGEEDMPSAVTAGEAAAQPARVAEAVPSEATQALAPEEALQQHSESPDQDSEGSQSSTPGKFPLGRAVPAEDHIES